jgi:hypothetical protein
METLQTLQYSPGSVDLLRSFLFQARLMAPHEVTESFALRGLLMPPELKSHWSLCGEITEAMFDEVKDAVPSEMALRLSAFTTTLGGAYLVLTHQLKSRQHRFVLPLWDTGVLAGVSALSQGKLKFMLAQHEAEMAVVFSSGFKPHEVEPVLAYGAPDDPDQLLKLFAEMPAVVQTLRQLQAVPSCHWQGPIKEVAVSVVAPVDAAMRIVKGGSFKH